MRLLICSLLLLLSPLALSNTFTFTAIPDQDESNLRSRFDQVAVYLSNELGVEVKYVPVKSYAAAITAFRNNQVQLAWFGGLSGVQARQRVKGSNAIAQGFEDQFFKSYFIAHSSTGLTAADNLPAALKDKTFTFGSKGSTSGRLMPEYYLRQQFEQAPQQLFSKVGFSGDHNRTIELVQAGSYQIGAVNYKVWESALAAGKIDSSKVSVIWETPAFTDYQWTIRGDINSRFGADFSSKVQQALLNIDDPKLLQAFPRSKFIAANNDDYQAIKATAQAIGLID
ncbi:putative selenate ABC transporter substrate-binding protein [Ferrimonas lipolytica]|uniref:Putative selenate ABC transporter substrate-binding protein n=1 Tax=Ferrimonas lipolytica TaxID=2724191 RepID=A0A6H1UAB2_9GAMM|nr:putative selenate ABC transporter substrate-binding protein [Ferrimonas lipolytica]QIZ75974.1 putative selenate ABC transporter substrate-binding protein [Ferrimonas lipolytica]